MATGRLLDELAAIDTGGVASVLEEGQVGEVAGRMSLKRDVDNTALLVACFVISCLRGQSAFLYVRSHEQPKLRLVSESPAKPTE